MTAAAYIRVSSRTQSHAMQRSAIEHAAASRGDAIATWHAERLSGKSLARPELERLRAAVRAGTVRKVYVYRLDRLARSGIRDTLEIVEELRTAGCTLVTIADGFDLTGPAADVVLAVLAWAAQAERLAINERISAARERLAREGRPWGRPPRLTTTAVERARALRREGRSVRGIAVAMKVPKSTVARALAVPESSPPRRARNPAPASAQHPASE
jgi:site-specific DNA recombinase